MRRCSNSKTLLASDRLSTNANSDGIVITDSWPSRCCVANANNSPRWATSSPHDARCALHAWSAWRVPNRILLFRHVSAKVGKRLKASTAFSHSLNPAADASKPSGEITWATAMLIWSLSARILATASETGPLLHSFTLSWNSGCAYFPFSSPTARNMSSSSKPRQRMLVSVVNTAAPCTRTERGARADDEADVSCKGAQSPSTVFTDKTTLFGNP
mmetsp:Transcript_22328/g.63941  ORF Transcript_22328/g.63941 Transcript_22328/m.63941 type:complete len:216 (+) Transcript_22328:717-1364(+)